MWIVQFLEKLEFFFKLITLIFFKIKSDISCILALQSQILTFFIFLKFNLSINFHLHILLMSHLKNRFNNIFFIIFFFNPIILKCLNNDIRTKFEYILKQNFQNKLFSIFLIYLNFKKSIKFKLLFIKTPSIKLFEIIFYS